MLKKINFKWPQLLTLLFASIMFLSFQIDGQKSASTKYKCMVQLTNYTGEGAYIIVSVLDGDNNYMKTLQVLGDDEEWYPDLPKWWRFYRNIQKPDIDGITGATIAGGERSIFVIEIEDDMINSGNQIRFETAVEDQQYHENDLQFQLTTTNVEGKFEGEGYIRYVRMIPQK